MKKLVIIFILMMSFVLAADQEFQFEESWGEEGINLIDQSANGIDLIYSVKSFTLQDQMVDGSNMSKVNIAGQLLPAEEGMPDLPSFSRFIAIPEGASVRTRIISSRTEIIENVDLIPAPRIPLDTEDGPLQFRKNSNIYKQNAIFPKEPIKISEVTEVRGVDTAILAISPFQYNPVTKQLVVNRDMEIEVEFTGGNGNFGEERLRSIWWEPILSGTFLNYEMLPDFNVNKTSNSRTEDYEYIIIVPDDPDFLSWAQTIADFRIEQGIRTGIKNTTEIGGNTTTAIETYINDAYNNWDIPPAAVLLIGDYGTVGNTIVSPIWNNYCVSDHIYADVTGNSLTDVVFARITARDAQELETMINKMLDYEQNPITDADYYDHPVTALGWQTERWFQLCSEAIGGFWFHELNKDRVRINAVYDGNPDIDPWSYAQNTSQVLNYFGPNGLGYIPQTPGELGGWTGGTGAMVNQAIEDGAFMLVHRDHGYESGWGEPDYNSTYVNMLNNDKPVFVWSINCLTGKYNMSGDSFAEVFHRHQTGALGLIAASEVSYSFVNDAYMWGAMDHMWPDFMPDMGTNPTDCDFILPAFANAAGKTFLYGSNWPYNSQSKPVTYNLFHQHGGAFMNVYSEVPQNITVSHSNELLSGLDTFEVTADEGSFIGLSVNGEVIGTAVGTGSAISIQIPVQIPNNTMKVTVTKQNHYRYSADVMIIAPDQYVIFDSVDLVEIDGHIDNSIQSMDTVQMDVTLNNIGLQPTGNAVNATLSATSNMVNILNDTAVFGQIPASGFSTLQDAFQVEFTGSIEDETIIDFTLEVESGGTTWISDFEVLVLAPDLAYDSFDLELQSGIDEILDPGENADIYVDFMNNGSGFAYNTSAVIFTSDPYVTLNGSGFISVIDPGTIGTTEQPIQVTIADDSPVEYFAEINVIVQDETGLSGQFSFNLPIGFIAHNFEAGEGGWTHMVLGDDWVDEWHLSSFRNFTIDGMYSMKCGGPDDTSYANFMYAALVMPEIELGSAATIKFHHWMDVGANNNGMTWDGGIIEISANSGDWEQVTPVGGYPCTMLNMPTSPFPEGLECFAGSIDWEEVTLDLSGYSGMAQIRFVLGSTGLVTGEGWYIDDVYYTNPTGSDDETTIPLVTELKGNYPNPFNPSTTISFSINKESDVQLEVFNVRGQKVKTLVSAQLDAGAHDIIWNGRDDQNKTVSSGVYFYKMKADKFVQTQKMILMK
ncbi:MAG: T9SS type A sorting domain-containing protein [Candidatus Cloacimonetes bacterium]|nr:T9SS type A sorting domain-containing protein [Candidatus Cloacimonadota bacterium]MCF7815233.1 T9SS type A sorting domain-containing protein [Candidatus Cloacimonadota bacterium]MCF7869394.1 T9SS type A sorting domain-containing protein [Candidatus Cloacimonadota bacterium]MCF7884794.1 T9SS type A sorting domain-containing protein [Candidatus Cloacimonadota bacterium]